MRHDEEIHTTIPKELKKEILNYGKGELRNGLINILNMLRTKEITINIITEIEL